MGRREGGEVRGGRRRWVEMDSGRDVEDEWRGNEGWVRAAGGGKKKSGGGEEEDEGVGLLLSS